jgi:hypothetical protein
VEVGVERAVVGVTEVEEVLLRVPFNTPVKSGSGGGAVVPSPAPGPTPITFLPLSISHSLTRIRALPQSLLASTRTKLNTKLGREIEMVKWVRGWWTAERLGKVVEGCLPRRELDVLVIEGTLPTSRHEIIIIADEIHGGYSVNASNSRFANGR